jgi:hypothetical protein
MKNTLQKIEINQPCTENWDKMNPFGQNKFCQSCEKMVIDFSPYSDKEIIDFFNQKNNQKTCGRFTNRQLHVLNQQLANHTTNHSNRLLIPILATTLLTASACHSTKSLENTTCEKPSSNIKIVEYNINPDSLSTTKIIGKIVDEQNEPLISVNVYIENSKIGTRTDFDGEFELVVAKEPNETANLKIEYIAYQSITTPIKEIKNKEIEIVLKEDETNLIGEVVIIHVPWYKRLWWKVFR